MKMLINGNLEDAIMKEKITVHISTQKWIDHLSSGTKKVSFRAVEFAKTDCKISRFAPFRIKCDYAVMPGKLFFIPMLIRSIFIAILFCCVGFQNLNAAKANGILLHTGGDSILKLWSTSGTELAPEEWKALWIWKKGESGGKNLSVIVRKRFVLNSPPEKAKVFITADNMYELYINGMFVNRGPVRSHPRKQSYDILEISPLLKEGENVMVIRALHHGSYGTYNLPPRPGILVQMEIQNGGKKEMILSDSSFKINRYDAFDLSSENYSEIVDLRKIEKGWKELDFDDSKWEYAEELVSDKFLGWPGPSPKSKPQTLISPWFELVPRDIPYLHESIARSVKVYETGEILELGFNSPVTNGLNNLLFPLKYCTVSDIPVFEKGEGSLTIKNSYPSSLYSNDAIYSTYLVLDMGKLMHGFPHLEIEGDPGTIIELVYAPHLLRGKFPLRTMHQGRPAERPAADKIILDKGKNTWSSLELKYMRYLFISIRNTDKPVKLNFAGMIASDYPFVPNGSFSVKNDEEINWLWKAARNTLDAITTDAYTDNYRERLQYSQTSYYAARCSYAAYGDSYLQRRYLREVALEQQSDGILPASAPLLTHRGQRFLDASIFWVLGLHDYYLHSGDEIVLKELLPKAEMILDRFKAWENKDGFIDTPPYTYWIDHANIERFGANFSLNALYLLMMKDVMALNSWLGNKEKASEYELRIENLKKKMQLMFWDEDEKLFRDNILNGSLDGKYTEHSNSLAIVGGIASPIQEKEIVKEFVENKSSRLVHSVIFMHYIVEALFKAGYSEAALALLKDRYSHMNIEGSSTLWEEWGMTVSFRTGKFEPNSSRTVSQAENTFISYSLSNWLLGIHPSKPGLAEVIIKPNMSGLNEISGIMPSPKGNIPVKWITTKKGMSLDIEVPEGVVALLDLNKIGLKTVFLDGENVTEAVSSKKYLSIPSGKHKVELL